MGTQSSAHMLGWIGDQVFHASHNLVQKRVPVNQAAETCRQSLSHWSDPVAGEYAPGIWPAIAVRTSASVSLRSFTNEGTMSRVTTSSCTAFAICHRVRAVKAGTRQGENVPFHIGRRPCIGPSNSYPRTNSVGRSTEHHGWAVVPWESPPRWKSEYPR